MNIKTFKIHDVPSSIYYIPDFITRDEEAHLLSQVNSAPKPKWTQLSNRRLQNWGGLPHPKGMIPERLPDWLESCCNNVAKLGVFGGKAPNHVLVNEYLPGQGIMPHTDGPLYEPTVVTLSLGSHTLLDFYTPLPHSVAQESSTDLADRHFASILLEPRSLVIVQDDMYSSHLHGIQEVTTDLITDKVANKDRCTVGSTLERGTRVSLTIRVVPKVLKTKVLFCAKR